MLKEQIIPVFRRKKKVKFPVVRGMGDITKYLAAIHAENFYYTLMQALPLTLITNAKHADIAERIIEYLSKAFGKKAPRDVMLYKEVLVILLDVYDEKHYIKAASQISPCDFLKTLLEEEELQQKDLVPHCFRSASQVSEFLNQKSGRQKLSWTQASALGKQFNVDPTNFLE